MVRAGFAGRMGPPARRKGATYTGNLLNGTLPTNVTFARASAANYWNSAGVRIGAAVDAPRFDYNPVTLQPRGLLIEGSRTNYLLNSLAPVTQTTAILIAGTYTLWMEGAGSVASSAGTAIGTGFGTATGGALGTYGTPNVITITTAGTVTITVTGSVTAFQLENGSAASSMITTTGATATRASDIANINDLSTLGYNATEGTIFVNYEAVASISNARTFSLATSSGSSANSLVMLNEANANAFIFNGGTGTRLSSGASFVGSNQKGALGYKSNLHAYCVNNGSVATSNVNLPSGMLLLALGSTGATAQLFGWIKSLAYYNTRLSDAAIKALTA